MIFAPVPASMVGAAHTEPAPGVAVPILSVELAIVYVVGCVFVIHNTAQLDFIFVNP
jgi:hypothetical protein